MDGVGQSWVELRLLGLVQARGSSAFCSLGLCGTLGVDLPRRMCQLVCRLLSFTANHESSGVFGRLTDGWFDFFPLFLFPLLLRFPHGPRVD